MVYLSPIQANVLWFLALLAVQDVALVQVRAVAIPRAAPIELSGAVSSSASSTWLQPVATYTLYFESNGATVAGPVASSKASSVATSTSSTSMASACTSSGTACSASRHSSVSDGSLPSLQATCESAASASTTEFPTVSAAIPTSTAGLNAAAAKNNSTPHQFVNKLNGLVQQYDGLTGRKARQLALILTNQTQVVANITTTQRIFSDLQRSYSAAQSNNSTTYSAKDVSMSGSSAVNQTNSVLDATTADLAKTFPHQYIISSGRSNLTLYSNTPSYGPSEVRRDLHQIRAWAGDLNQLSTAPLLDETVAAIMSASARYFPELSTVDAARIIMSDIKAESDFDVSAISGGRIVSGSSWGLMQVSPFGSSAELQLFKSHATVTKNVYSWVATLNVTTTPTSFGAGPLLDWKTGSVMDIKGLTENDLLRPWVNIHIATWIQSNLARTSSQDPSTWQQIYQQTNAAKNAAAGAISSSTNSNSTSTSTTKTTAASSSTAAWAKVNAALVGSGLARTFKTGLGSWVAGPAVDGFGSYSQSGDDVSKTYFQNIVQGLSVLYNSTVKVSWLDSTPLTPGLIDYH